MVEELKAFMRSRDISGNVNIGTLLDELDVEGDEDLIDDMEERMEIEGLTDSHLVSALLERLEVDDKTKG